MKNLDCRNIPMPAGCIRQAEAATMLGVSERAVRKMVYSGRIPSEKVQLSPMRSSLFPHKEAVEALVEAGEYAPKPDKGDPIAETNPLISHKDNLCTAARREMFERAGRRINFRKLLASGKRVG